MSGGAGNDTFTYNITAGRDVAVLDGGPDTDTVTINAYLESFRLLSETGAVLYQRGTGGPVITVKNLEHGKVIANDGSTILFQW